MSNSNRLTTYMPRLGKIEGGARINLGKSRVRPLLSIITVVFSARNELAPLIESVLHLKDENTEFIVIDGGSWDGTIELLNEYDSEIDYWVSEPDLGIYDAMNKGIAAAKGVFVVHLNAGDKLLYVPIPELKAADVRGSDALAFRVFIPGRGEFKPSYKSWLKFNNTLHHQGTFFRRQSLPPYDIKYKVFADFDANQRLALRGANIEIFNHVVASHLADGASDINSKATTSEFFGIISKNYGISHVPIAWMLCKWRGLTSRIKRMRDK